MKFTPQFKGHFLVVGNTGTGKGVLTSAVSRNYRKQNIPVYLLTNKEDEYMTFPADWKTRDQDQFLDHVMNFKGSIQRNGEEHALGLIAVIDEAWAWDWKGKLEAIPNAGRSRGIEMWCQCQRMNQVIPSVRTNCDNVFLFRQKNPADIDVIEKLFGEEFAKCRDFKNGEFIADVQDEVFKGIAFTNESGNFKSI